MNRKPGRSCEVALTVPFHDLDPFNIVWHGNYLKYFDRARFALFDVCGVDVRGFDADGERYVFPVIKTSTKHVFPLQHKDEFICRAVVSDASVKLVLDFEIRLAADGKLCARGRGEQVAVKLPDMEMALQIPEDARRAFGFTP